MPARSGLSAAQTRDVFYDYDLRGLQTRARFDSLSGEGVTSQYDGLGRLTASTLAMAGTSRTLQFRYNPDGSRRRITHADGAAFGYLYDGLGRVTHHYEINASPGPNDHVIRYWYKPTGERSAEVRGAGSGGFSTTHYYDSAMRPSVLANNLPVAGADVSFGFGWNPAGQIATLARDNDSYAFAAALPARTYAADGLNRYTSVSGTPYVYDANGNLTFDGSTTFAYDVENRLVGASGAPWFPGAGQSTFRQFSPATRRRPQTPAAPGPLARRRYQVRPLTWAETTLCESGAR